MRISVSVFSLFFISIAALAQTPSQSSKIDPSLLGKFRSQAPVKFSGLVILKDQTDLSGADKLATPAQKGRYIYDALRGLALKSQAPLVQFLTSRHANFERFYIENMIALYDATPDLINQVAARGDVLKILDNPNVRISRPKSLPLWETRIATPGPEQNIVSTGATKVWSAFKDTGRGIVIGAQDTGVQWDHPALKSHYRGFDGTNIHHDYNWHDSIHQSIVGQPGPCGLSSSVPCDDYGHGTHTLGTMVGDDGQGNQIGMAPGAKWMACRNMDQGVGRPSTYIECFEWFLAPYPVGGNSMTDGDPSKAPNVINNSWGCLPEEHCSGADLLPAIQAVEKAGIMVVASAGNDGPDCSTIDDAPAMYSGTTFTVGAYDHRTGMIADFSSRGPSRFDGGIGPDISAPGVGIRSSVPDNSYEEDDGTSMAGPHVVGAVALLWSADPKLIGDLVTTKRILESTAAPATTSESCGGIPGSAVPNNTFGYGQLDVYHAVHASLESRRSR